MKMTQVYDIMKDPNLGKEKSDVIALYLLYYKHSFIRKKMRLSSIKVEEASNLLSISVHRIRTARKVLYQKDLICNYSEPNPLSVLDHYVKLLETTV